MNPLVSFLPLVHLIGLVLAVGAATVKLVLLLKCNTDYGFVPVYLNVARPITRLIILGLILLTLSGIGWLVAGYPFTVLLGVKIGLVVAIWALGSLIDKLAEPRFQKLAPAPGKPASEEFLGAQKRYVRMEMFADFLFYFIIVIWVFR